MLRIAAHTSAKRQRAMGIETKELVVHVAAGQLRHVLPAERHVKVHVKRTVAFLQCTPWQAATETQGAAGRAQGERGQVEAFVVYVDTTREVVYSQAAVLFPQAGMAHVKGEPFTVGIAQGIEPQIEVGHHDIVGIKTPFSYPPEGIPSYEASAVVAVLPSGTQGVETFVAAAVRQGERKRPTRPCTIGSTWGVGDSGIAKIHPLNSIDTTSSVKMSSDKFAVWHLERHPRLWTCADDAVGNVLWRQPPSQRHASMHILKAHATHTDKPRS